MELSDVMSFGERIALKLRFGWDTVEEDEHSSSLMNKFIFKQGKFLLLMLLHIMDRGCHCITEQQDTHKMEC